MRIGMGYDVHKLVENRDLILGGVKIPYEKGLLGHSDADVLLHAIMDALLGAAALGDIGKHFPDTDPAYKGASSMELLKQVGALIEQKLYVVGNIDATIIAQRPKMAPHIEKMRENVAEALGIEKDQINIKATTEEGLGFTGSGEGISSQAIAAAREEIIKMFGEEYSSARKYKTKSKGAQEAHEAIRPSYLNRQQIEGSPEEKRLYDLIWKRTVASQMSPARIEKTVVSIAAGESPYKFTATGEVILFDGFLRLYSETVEDETEEGQENTLPELKAGDGLSYQDISATERFTQPPFRYSEASLVRRLEELGIGRPSTYAPTISTIINRGYVIKQNKQGTKRSYRLIRLEKGKISSKELSETTGREKAKLTPTDIGMIVNDYLDKHFEEILDYNFTANVEKEFDEIAEGGKEWTNMIREFYTAFHPTVEKALEELPDRSGRERILGTDPKSGKQVSARIGRYGPIVQIGSADDEEKPRYASMKKDQLIATITLDEALALFELPRTLGELDGKEVVVSIGRYGPYIRYDGKFTSLPRKDDPYSVTLERAVELIHEKESAAKASKEPIKVFDAEPEIKVLNGRYGPYIASGGKNYRIPKDTDPATLTLEQVRDIMAKSKK